MSSFFLNIFIVVCVNHLVFYSIATKTIDHYLSSILTRMSRLS